MAFPNVVVVTGASAGVGRATARLFAKKGADVALIARGIDGLNAAKREVEALGRRVLVIPVDVSDADALENAATNAEQELGPIDVWANVAMVSVFSPFLKMTPAEFKRVTASLIWVMCTAPCRPCAACSREIAAQLCRLGQH